MLVGQRLRWRRRMLGLTQQQLGAACGVSFQQIQKYECAYSRMSVAMLWKLACVLDVDAGYFFAGLPQARAADDARPAPLPAPRRANAA